MKNLIPFETVKKDFLKKYPEEETNLNKDILALEIIFKLRAEREKLKVTQSQLAKLSGVNQDKISRIENGLHNPTIITIHKLAQGLGKKVNITFE